MVHYKITNRENESYTGGNGEEHSKCEERKNFEHSNKKENKSDRSCVQNQKTEIQTCGTYSKNIKWQGELRKHTNGSRAITKEEKEDQDSDEERHYREKKRGC